MCTVKLPPRDNPIEVNKYMNINVSFVNLDLSNQLTDWWVHCVTFSSLRLGSLRSFPSTLSSQQLLAEEVLKEIQAE